MTVEHATLHGGATRRTFEMVNDVYVHPIEFYSYSNSWDVDLDDVIKLRDPNGYMGQCCVEVDFCHECGYMGQECVNVDLSRIRAPESDKDFEAACWRWWKARQLNFEPAQQKGMNPDFEAMWREQVLK